MFRLATIKIWLTGGISMSLNSNSVVSNRLSVVSDLRFDVGILYVMGMGRQKWQKDGEMAVMGAWEKWPECPEVDGTGAGH